MKDAEKRFPFIPFLVNLLIPLVFGALAAMLRDDTRNSWFQALIKPEYHPSPTRLAIIRSSMFLTIGIASFLVWTKRKSFGNYNQVLAIYFTQLGLNLTWSLLFYYIHNLVLSMANIFVLIVVIMINIHKFYKIDKAAGWLLVPYLLWVMFAASMAVKFYYLN